MLSCFEVSWPLPIWVKFKTNREKKNQIIGPDFQTVSYLKNDPTLVSLQKWTLPYDLSDIVYESPLIFLTFHNMQIDRNGLQFVRVALVLTTMIGIDLSQNGRRFESKQLFFIWKVLRTLRKWHNLPIFWQWSTISVPEKKKLKLWVSIDFN